MTDAIDIAVAAASDVGAVREHNEDTLLVGDLDTAELVEPGDAAWHSSAERGPLLVVCDGMGGAVGGEVASRLAADVIWREMKRTAATRDPEVFARLLRRATRVANHDVHATGKREPGLRGMGTTVSAAGIAGDRLVVATVGDSRAYVLRAGALVQVTRDQSLAAALESAGRGPDAINAGSAILQALGVNDDVEPSLSIIELRRGDRVLLCSDGLHGLVGDPALALLMSEPHTVGAAVTLLVKAASAAGGIDNITAIVAEIAGDRFVPPADDDDLPAFREFDPQEEGDRALAPESQVAQRLAARVGLAPNRPSMIPVTGQHAVMTSRVGIRPPPATATPIEDVEGPARARLRGGGVPAWAIAGLVVLACAIAWVLGGR